MAWAVQETNEEPPLFIVYSIVRRIGCHYHHISLVLMEYYIMNHRD